MRKKWIFLFAFFLAALVLVSFRGGRLAYMLFYFVTAVPVVSFLYALAVRMRFKFFQSVSAVTAVKKEPLDYCLKIQNEDRFFYEGIAVDFFRENSRVSGMEEALSLHLEAGACCEREAKLVCKYRGEYEVGVSRFYISDYLHLFRIPYRVKEPLKLTVLPRIVRWEYEDDILREADGKNQGSGDGALDILAREFQTGDALRQIHWKASARMGKLMSRETFEDQRQGMLLLLDLKRIACGEAERLRYEDEMMEQAVAAVYACKLRGIPVTVVCDWGGRKVFRIVSNQEWKDFYDASGRMSFAAEHSAAHLVCDMEIMREAKYAVFLTGTLDRALYGRIERDFSDIRTSVIAVLLQTASKEEALFSNSCIAVYRTYAE